MLGVIGKIFAGIAALVTVVSLMAGPTQAARTAGSAFSTVGTVTGAMIGAVPAMMTGFNTARLAGITDRADQARRRREAAQAHRQMLRERKQNPAPKRKSAGKAAPAPSFGAPGTD